MYNGGHVRVGLEDNVRVPNSELVRGFAHFSQGRAASSMPDVMSAAQVWVPSAGDGVGEVESGSINVP